VTALVRYHGGKVRLADRIVSLFPPHDCYCEPFGGGAAVLMAKSRARLEVYNDLDGDMVALFRAVRDRPKELARAVALTPYSREEFEQSLARTEGDDLERARRMLVRSHLGHGGAGTVWRTGFSKDRRNGVVPCDTWLDLPAVVRAAAERMRGVVIEQRPAVEVLGDHDSPSALHYVDPPYVHEARGRHRYRHEMSVKDHEILLECLRGLRGAVILSGYASPLYDGALQGWRRIEIKAKADKCGDRVEVLWCNFADSPPLMQTAAAKEEGK
jgi:DNA adenine methylase